MTAGVLVHDFGAENIRRHQIGRELHAAGIKAENGAERRHQLGLGKAGDADKQGVTAGQHRKQGLLDHTFLTEDDLADFGPHERDLRECVFRRGNDRLFVGRFARALHHTHGRTPRSPVVEPNRPAGDFQLPYSNLDPG
ncbi:hypothetical protein D9M72_520530 [compost metagenome]